MIKCPKTLLLVLCTNLSVVSEVKLVMVVRFGERISLSPLTNQKVRPKESSVKHHLLLCRHTPSLDDFSLLAYENNKICLEIKEAFI